MEENKFLELHVLDVGHGDSLVLCFPDGHSFGIIDCHRHGTSKRGFGFRHDADEPKALTYFQNLVVKGASPVVEFACLTHPHADHYTGFAVLLESLLEMDIPIREYWDFGASARKARVLRQMSRLPAQEQLCESLERLCIVQLRLLEDHGCRYRILASPARGFWSGHGVTIDVVAPPALLAQAYWNFLACNTYAEQREFLAVQPHAGDDNVISSALRICYEDARLLLGGDVIGVAWREIVRDGSVDLGCQALKVSHHGSKGASFLDNGTPVWHFFHKDPSCLIAAISGGYRPSLPHADTLFALERDGVTYYCTGPISTAPACPYRPSSVSDAMVLTQLELEGVLEVADASGSGSGDITVTLATDGTCEVCCER